MSIDASDIMAVTKSVTKKWTKQRKAEERNSQNRSQREHVYSDRVNFTDVAEGILPAAYEQGSENGKYPLSKRQFYYACRDEFENETGREITYKHFGSLLLKYMNQNSATNAWRVTADPRGSLLIPNTNHGLQIPCGTIDIDKYLSESAEDVDPFDIGDLPTLWPSNAAKQRYQAVLYIEKEGFGPLLEQAKIAERYDLAILSCKGQSVVAARKLVDRLCAVGDGVPLFVVHDLDKAGFEIKHCLTQVSRAAEAADRVAYRFKNEINATDFGLSLVDAQKYGLATEKCPKAKKRIPGATDDEMELLRSGRRIELNAFSPAQFIEWLEGKLKAALPKRLIPSNDVLDGAYRRAMAVAEINNAIEAARDEAVENAKAAKIPKTLRRQIQKAMKESPEQAWDAAIYELAKTKVYPAGND